MCIAVPSKIVKIAHPMGTVDVGGVRKEVSLILVEDAKVGDYVAVHAGFAIGKIDPSEARESLKILRKVAEAAQGEEDER